MFPLACPECRGRIEAPSPACTHCGYPLIVAASPVPMAPVLSDSPSPILQELSPLQEIAYRQKLVLCSLGLSLCCTFPLLLLSMTPYLYFAAVFFWGVLGLLQLWCLYKLGRALALWLPTVFVMCALQLVPCVSLSSLLYVDGLATERLRRAGVNVGLLGADLRAVP